MLLAKATIKQTPFGYKASTERVQRVIAHDGFGSITQPMTCKGESPLLALYELAKEIKSFGLPCTVFDEETGFGINGIQPCGGFNLVWVHPDKRN